jgi:hypothetical protein
VFTHEHHVAFGRTRERARARVKFIKSLWIKRNIFCLEKERFWRGFQSISRFIRCVLVGEARHKTYTYQPASVRACVQGVPARRTQSNQYNMSLSIQKYWTHSMLDGGEASPKPRQSASDCLVYVQHGEQLASSTSRPYMRTKAKGSNWASG